MQILKWMIHTIRMSYKGLPPGPIAGAGKSSIEAVIDPAKTDYLLFLSG